jgi:hypothetical protein
VKCIRFLPLVFLTGIDGFAMFAPYVILLFLAGYLLSLLRTDSASLPLEESELPQQSI